MKVGLVASYGIIFSILLWGIEYHKYYPLESKGKTFS